MRKEVERVAALGGVAPADVIRLCIKSGLPSVERGFRSMGAMLDSKKERNHI